MTPLERTLILLLGKITQLQPIRLNGILDTTKAYRITPAMMDEANELIAANVIVPEWSFVFEHPGGHSYYRPTCEPDSRLIAVADNSMRRRNDPSSTDDGLLYIDRSRPVRLNNESGAFLPLTKPLLPGPDPDGGGVDCTGMTLIEAIRVIDRFELAYELDDTFEELRDLFIQRHLAP